MRTKAKPAPKRRIKPRIWISAAVAAALWVLFTLLLPRLFGKPAGGAFRVELAPARVNILGLSVNGTVVTTWVIMGIILVFAALIRIFCIPRMKSRPKGLQNALEVAVENIERYTGSKVDHASGNLAAYIFTVAVLLISCALAELFGVRAPTSDITMTFALAIITFFLINYYGIRRKGLFGRIKSLAQPTPIVLPLRVISDCALPVSLACRLFGNMLGGMVVMDLLYHALGSGAFGFPAVVGLYFNAFHPLVQAFIFITLSLTFIGEATE